MTMASKKNDSNNIKFEVGKPCFVWKVTGVKDGKNGPTTSERTGQDFDDIDPSEPLMVLTKYGSNKALCKRPDGQEVTVHINHINSKSPYYANRSAKESAPALTKEQELAQAEAQAAAAMKHLDTLRTQEAEPEVQTISDEDRDEAAALFEEAASA